MGPMDHVQARSARSAGGGPVRDTHPQNPEAILWPAARTTQGNCGLNLRACNRLPEGAFQNGTEWGVNMGGRVISFAFIEVERGPVVPRGAEIVGSVIIFGLNELQCANHCTVDFIEAWRDAMCLEIGSEEFEKFCVERGNR